jgi:ABC-type lipoprotein export system ATPase subunit
MIEQVESMADTHINLEGVGGNKDSGAIVLHDVFKIYETPAGKFPALKGVNLRLNYGEFVSIVGKSGSGKSTLLNMITGIDHPTSGEVLVGDKDIYAMNESQRALWRGRTIGIVFQFFQLLPTLTLLENTMLPMDYCNVYAPLERPERAMELLSRVGLVEQAHKLPSSVSSGQQQSAAIARALATDPPIIVADEPTGNLDSRSADKIIQLFAQLAAQGKTIVIVTHDPSITSRTDRTVIISDGKLIDETITKALPLLNHHQMLQATELIETRVYAPGASIIHQGEQVRFFFMIKRGEVMVVLSNPACPELIVARLGPGEFFGEVELMRGGNSIAGVRASSSGPVELALLPHETFTALIAGSPLTEDALSRVVQARVAQNRAQDERCRKR